MANTTNTRIASNRVSAVLSLGLVLFTLGLAGLLVIYAFKINPILRQNLPFVVYINDTASQGQLDSLKTTLNKPGSYTVARFVDKKTALKEFKNDLGEDFTDVPGENFLEQSLELALDASFATPGNMARLAADCKKSPLVTDVVYSEEITTQLNQQAELISLAVTAFALLLLIVCIALINSSIRLDIFSKRILIKSMLLVGATQGFIRKPFVVRSVANGLYAWLIATVLLAIVVAAVTLKPTGLYLEMIFDVISLSVLTLGLLLVGLFISYISTLFAMQRYFNARTTQVF